MLTRWECSTRGREPQTFAVFQFEDRLHGAFAERALAHDDRAPGVFSAPVTTSAALALPHDEDRDGQRERCAVRLPL